MQLRRLSARGTVRSALALGAAVAGLATLVPLAAPAAAAAGGPTITLRDGLESGAKTTTAVYGRFGDVTLLCDWDGDGDDTLGVYRPADATWHLRNATGGGNAELSFRFGRPASGDRALCGDWDGDGRDGIGVYRNSDSTWYLLEDAGGGAADMAFRFGRPGVGDRPLAGDWDGDGDDTVGVYRTSDSTWYLHSWNGGGSAALAFRYGRPGADDTPVTGDWDGTGIDRVGVLRGTDQVFLLAGTNAAGNARWTVPMANGGPTAAVDGDHDGDGRDEVGTVTLASTGASGTVGTIAGFAAGGHFPTLSVDAIARELDGMKASGATWVRVSFNWATLEPAPGRYNFDGKHAEIARLAAARGLRVLAMVGYPPKWARDPVCAGTLVCQPADNGAYARFLRAVVDRFSPMGVRTYELWNEPNLSTFWLPKPDVARYTDLVRRSWSAVKGAHPEVTLLAGVLAPAQENSADGKRVRPQSFLAGMYDRGARGYFDRISFHPYNAPSDPSKLTNWKSFSSVVPELKAIMTQRGDAAKAGAIWGTEYGWSTGTTGKSVTEAQQRDRIAPAYNDWQDLSTAPLFWFTFRDSGTDRTSMAQNYGLVKHDHTPKLALPEWRRVMTLPLG